MKIFELLGENKAGKVVMTQIGMMEVVEFYSEASE